MSISEIQSQLATIAQNSLIYDERNFEQRFETIDFIEFELIGRIEELLLTEAQQDELVSVKHRAEKIKAELEEIDRKLFQTLRENIRAKNYTGDELTKLVKEYTGFSLNDNKHQEEPGYDHLDIFINGLLAGQVMPEQTKELEPEMVFYQKTPARIVFELAEQLHFSKEDVFFDLGSGLGQVVVLINLLTDINAKGVEFEPAFYEYAQDCADALNLSGVEFITTDARHADYSEGTVFFLYTPFKGGILQDVLERLRKESLQRKIRIITYGPCTGEVGLQNWLNVIGVKSDNIYKLHFFNSI